MESSRHKRTGRTTSGAGRITRSAPTWWLVAMVMIAAPAFGGVSNNNLFELDGDAIDASAGAPDDWQTINAVAGTGAAGGAIAHTGVLADPGSASIFTGGGSKDVRDISAWRRTDGSVPDKDNILNAYAAAYKDGDDHLILYFGADRFSTEGDAQLGFWFFKNNITENGGNFNGVHAVGDVLVLVNFEQGGTVPLVEVLEWVGGKNPLSVKFPLTAVACSTSADLAACAITNPVNAQLYWSYTPKFDTGAADTAPPQAFFEGGIDVTELVPGSTCFATFLAETRSSSSETAQLKDYVIGAFPVCGISVTKTCEVVRLATAEDDTDKSFIAEFHATVTNTGAATIPAGTEITVVDDAGTPGDTSDDVTELHVLPVALATGESTDPIDGVFPTDDNPPHNTVTASAVIGGVTVTAAPYDVDCTALNVNPALFIEKDCTTALSDEGDVIAVKVSFNGRVCNTGDVPLTVDVSDDKDGSQLSDVVLAAGFPCASSDDCLVANGGPGGTCRGADAGEGILGVCDPEDDSVCRTFGGDYLPSQTTTTTPGDAVFSDTATVTAPLDKNPFLEASGVTEAPVDVATANCRLCPDCGS